MKRENKNQRERALIRMALEKNGLDKTAIYRAARQRGAQLAAGKGASPMKKHQRKYATAAVTVALAACLCVGGVAAAGYLLRPAEVATAMDNPALAALFEGAGAVEINETQTDAGYSVTLLGLTTGQNATAYFGEDWTAGTGDERSYAVFAVANADGTPMEEATSDGTGAFQAANSVVWPVIEIPGHAPMTYFLNLERQDIVKDGCRYIVVGCSSLEIFAGNPVALTIATGSAFYNETAFSYDAETGAVRANESYPGLNLVFALPLDESKADPAAVDAFFAQFAAPDTADEAAADDAAETDTADAADAADTADAPQADSSAE